MKITVEIIPTIMWFHEKGFKIDDTDKLLTIENKTRKEKLTYDKEFKILQVEYVECKQLNLETFKNSDGSFEVKNDSTLLMEKELADKLRELLKNLEE